MGTRGCGIGKIFKLGRLPLNGLVQAYYNVRSSDAQTLARWQLRAQLAFLFPTGKPKPAPKPEESGASAGVIATPPKAVTAQNSAATMP